MQGQLRFKVDFCRYIDHLYKISDATNNFLYYDLVQPGKPIDYHKCIFAMLKVFFYIVGYKKTIHLLKILLNYFLYNRMVRDEVVNVSTSKIKEFDSIISTRNKFHVENEKAKAHAENVRRALL